jgi:hypothetical protein
VIRLVEETRDGRSVGRADAGILTANAAANRISVPHRGARSLLSRVRGLTIARRAGRRLPDRAARPVAADAGGIGGIEGGLIGAFARDHAPLAATTVAVLAYRSFALWIPAVLGSVAFVQLRATLLRKAEPALICQPLADSIEPARVAAAAR